MYVLQGVKDDTRVIASRADERASFQLGKNDSRVWSTAQLPSTRVDQSEDNVRHRTIVIHTPL